MNARDITNQVFGRLTAKSRVLGDRKTKWLCECSCGKTVTVRLDHIVAGAVKSCGCFCVDTTRERSITHGKSGTTEYSIWAKMRDRCSNPNSSEWKWYGARGIKVCDRWQDFENFLADVGPRPSLGHSIDRYPNKDGGYEPGNVRWATDKEQANNLRSNRPVEADGRRLNLCQWSEETGVKAMTIRARLEAGRTPEEAISTGPLIRRNARLFEHEGKQSSARELAESAGIPVETFLSRISRGKSVTESLAV